MLRSRLAKPCGNGFGYVFHTDYSHDAFEPRACSRRMEGLPMALLPCPEDTTVGCCAAQPACHVLFVPSGEYGYIRSSAVLECAFLHLFKVPRGILNLCQVAAYESSYRSCNDKAGVLMIYSDTTLIRSGISLHIVSLAQVSLPNRPMMLLPQHKGPRLGGQAAADVLQVHLCPQYNSSRPAARRASLKVSAFETQAQPFKKSSASSSRCIPGSYVMQISASQ